MGKDLKPVILKFAGKSPHTDYRNKDAPEKVIGYILRETARGEDDLWGSMGTFGKSPKGILKDFRKLKKLYDKEDGVLLKHLILSWGERPNLPRKKMRTLIKKTLGFWGMEYQTVYAVHEDKGPDQYHMHIVLNSVSNTGKKIQITGKELRKFRKKFNYLWNRYGYGFSLGAVSEKPPCSI